MSSFFDKEMNKNKITGVSAKMGKDVGDTAFNPVTDWCEHWASPTVEEEYEHELSVPDDMIDFEQQCPPAKEIRHVTSALHPSKMLGGDVGPGQPGARVRWDIKDYGKKTTVFNQQPPLLVNTNMSDESTDSEVDEITNQPEISEAFGRFNGSQNLDGLTDEDLKPPLLLARQICSRKWRLPLKILNHCNLDHIHVQTKWVWKTKEHYATPGGIKGAWVYGIFKLQNDTKEKLVPKKVTIYVPKYYASRAYDIGRENFDDEKEFEQFLRSPQWWREISDFEDNSRLV
jgi:hypothetical protein